MLIGSWGPMVFYVSGIGALTFTEIEQDSFGRWVTHEVINAAPVTEFLGPGQDEVTIKITLSRMLGVDPKISYELLRLLVRKGLSFPLILRGCPLSGNLWYIENMNGISSMFAPGTGSIMWTELTCYFKEYR